LPLTAGGAINKLPARFMRYLVVDIDY